MFRGGRGGGRGGRGGWGGGMGRGRGDGGPAKERPLYPTFDVPHFPKPSNAEEDVVHFFREFLKEQRDLPYYLDPPPPRKDIDRYSDQYKRKMAHKSLTNCPADLEYFPSELHSVKDPSKRAVSKVTKRKMQMNWDDLEKDEGKALQKTDELEVNEDEDIEAAEEDDDDDEGDYGVDYYDEDQDLIDGDGSDGGNDRED
ncbi:DNA-directed RNA polymerase III, subunit Rpc31 [Cladochytrium replicatum]|nr:DNA-directed RNA polymerase III, subunit Rpc31 [Cladochytrium replicatum]